MGQQYSAITTVASSSNPKYNLYMPAIDYLANLQHDKYHNVFALRFNPANENVTYHHEFDSEDYTGTTQAYEKSRTAGTRCMYYVPWADSSYCVFYDIDDETQTIGVIDLENTRRVADISGCTQTLPIENIIEIAQQALDDDIQRESDTDAEGSDSAAECTNCNCATDDVNCTCKITDHDDCKCDDHTERVFDYCPDGTAVYVGEGKTEGCDQNGVGSA